MCLCAEREHTCQYIQATEHHYAGFGSHVTQSMQHQKLLLQYQSVLQVCSNVYNCCPSQVGSH